MQADAIPAVLSGEDVAIASETGSGKTLAYLLPIIHSLKQRQRDQQENRPDTAQCAHPPSLAAHSFCCHENSAPYACLPFFTNLKAQNMSEAFKRMKDNSCFAHLCMSTVGCHIHVQMCCVCMASPVACVQQVNSFEALM